MQTVHVEADLQFREFPANLPTVKKYALCTLIIGLGLLPVIGLAGARAALGRPAILYNPSPSEPTGLYRLSGNAPAPGRIIAFKVPAAGRAYAQAHIARTAILKQVEAGEGAVICEAAGIVSINGKARGTVAATDRHGAPLPHWFGCQRLHKGQYFVISNRIPNSFDSRYYGPVSDAELVGVYQPLWTDS
jgi:conjugative transfer signal peptidase TraF